MPTWSVVTPQPKDGHSLTGSIIQTQNLALRLNSQFKDQVTTARSSHLPSLGWLPTNPRMVTHHNEVNYKLRIWHSNLTNKNKTRNLALRLNSQDKDQVTIVRNGHLPFLGCSPPNPRMVTFWKEIYNRLGIWHLDLTHKTKPRWQLPGMVTYHQGDGHPPTQGWSPTRSITSRLCVPCVLTIHVNLG